MSFIERVITIINPLVKAGLRSPLHPLLLSRRIMLITVTGRKSGRRYTTPVSYTRQGNVVTCFTDRSGQWWRNLRAVPDVTLRLRGRDYPGKAEAVLDVAAVAAGLGPFLKALPGDAPVYGVTFHAQGEPNAAQVARAALNVVLIRITLEA